MKPLKISLSIFAVSVLILAGASGCANKQVKSDDGLKAQQPSATAPKGPDADAQAKGETKGVEAPPGPKEQPEPKESARDEKSLHDVHFEYDKYDINPAEAPILEKDAAWIKANPNASITIEGHCDERGTVEYNLALGEKRAAAAKHYLTMLGVKEVSLKTISYGNSKPGDPGHDEQAWAKNRRAHFVVQ
jgi:peptidoglycan-associated lipoprotein